MENMAEEITTTDRIRSYLVLAATIGVIVFNWIAATGRLGGVDTGEMSDRYQTLVTPAGYAFSIWSLIYLGLIAFSVYQLLPANVGRFRAFRSLYIFTCALNCAWLYFWHSEQIVICFVIISALCITLLVINYLLREPDSLADAWIAKAPFSIYFGWVTAATFVNFAIMLKYLRVDLSPGAETALAVSLILLVGAIAVAVRLKLANYFYPLAVAWALTAIAVKQSGQTAIVLVCAIGVVACLIASLSFVMNLRSTENPGA
jgi:benzodiazapine receptor